MMIRRTQVVFALALASAMLLGACASEKIEVLKSPCVGIEGSPCGPKRPVNGALNASMPEHS